MTEKKSPGASLRILVPSDGSPESAAALATVAAWSVSCRPEVLVLYVVEPGRARKDEADVRRICEDQRLRSLDLRILTAQGRPAEAIRAAAREQGADLIAMTTHGRTGIRRLVLGSVTEQVIRRSDIPVLVSRSEGALPPEGRILVPLDGSRVAEGILPDAIRAARILHTTLEVVQVVPEEVLPGAAGFHPPVRDPMPYLKGLCAGVERQGVEASAAVLKGPVVASLLEHACSRRVRLICAATYGRRGLARWVMGSSAEELLRESPCPVLVHRLESYASRFPRRDRLRSGGLS